MKQIDEKIRVLAKKSGLSIRKLCQKIDMSESGFYAMIKNDSMKLDTLQKIANFYNVKTSYFLDENIDVSEKLDYVKKIEESPKEILMNFDIERYLHQLEKENEELKKDKDFLKHQIEIKDLLLAK